MSKINSLAVHRALVAEQKANGTYVKPEKLDPVQKALANPSSMKYAIRAACWQCVGQGADSNWRDSIRDCTMGSEKCGLWHVRPK